MKRLGFLLAIMCISAPGFSQTTNTFPNSGYVGIGTTNPNRHIDIRDLSTSAMFVRMRNANSSTGGALFGLNSNNHFLIRLRENKSFRLFTNNVERMRMTKNGLLGLGTTSPLATLDVVGSFRLDNGTQQAGYFLTTDANGNASWSALPAAPASIWSQNGANVYYTGGNVGVGTTSPTNTLTVQTAAGNGVAMENASGDTRASLLLHNTSDFGMLNLYDNTNTRKAYIPASGNGYYTAGNFSIGTESHNNFKLNVQANTVYGIGLTHNGNTLIGLNKHNTGNYGIFEIYNNAQVRTIGLFASNTHSYINTGKNFGIGTTQPTSQLTVAGTIETTTGGIKFPDGTVQTTAAGSQMGTVGNPYTELYSTDFIKVGNNSLYLTGSLTSLPGGSGNEIFSDGGPLYINPTGASVGGVTSTGNHTYINTGNGRVAIGRTAPQQKLHLEGNLLVDNSGYLMFGGSPVPGGMNNGQILMRYDETAQEFKVFKPASSAAGLVPDILNLGDAGTVGMGGSANAGAQLYIKTKDATTQGIQLDMYSPSTDYTYGYLAKTENDNLKAFAVNRSDIGGQDVFIVWGDGRTFIGETNLAAGPCTDCGDFKLFVRGGVRTEKVKVDIAAGTWADYVFEKDYELKSLKEVESFIQKEGHLPGVPSAQEVEENGADLGEMNKVLLEKVEELTLYMIELKKENEELREMIEQK